MVEFEDKLDEEQPFLLAGCPSCTYGTKLNVGLNYPRLDENEVEDRLKRGRKHILNCIRFYRKQRDEGRYVLHEHPDGNLSWKELDMIDFAKEDGNYLVKSQMCRFGMVSEDAKGRGLVKKMIWYLTNSEEIARMLQGVCSNEDPSSGKPKHRHVHLMAGRTKAAEVYPPALVRAISQGVLNQTRVNGEISELSAGPTCDEPVVDPKTDEEKEDL